MMSGSRCIHVTHIMFNFVFTVISFKTTLITYLHSTLAPPSILSDATTALKGPGADFDFRLLLSPFNHPYCHCAFCCCHVSMCCLCMSGCVLIMTTPCQQKVNRGGLTTLACAFLSLHPSLPLSSCLTLTYYLLTTLRRWTTCVHLLAAWRTLKTLWED